MVQIQSGYYKTGNISPIGTPKNPPVDSQYMTKDEFLLTQYASSFGLTTSSPEYSNGVLDKLLLNASAQVNRLTRKYFDTQTIWETKTNFKAAPYNPKLTTIVLNNRPVTDINLIYVQVLQWYIQIISSGAQSYLQTFPEWGYKIVPMLSTSGTGTGSPIPSDILDKVDLGILWTNYTFGYGVQLTNQPLTLVTSSGSQTYTQYQAMYGNRLWAVAQANNPLNIYIGGVLQTPNTYTIDQANGIVIFNNSQTSDADVTADFTTNESIPQDIKFATALLAAFMYGQGKSNPLGASSMSMQTFSTSIDGSRDNPLVKQAKDILEPYISKMPVFMK